MPYSQELDFALSLADESRALIRTYFGTGMKVEWKGDNTPVTLADRAAEEAMRKRIAKETPGYGVIGEEFGKETGSAANG
jgi:fructose-1,6-bisphosphatase/inositol monophosphatase family enzyme